MSKNQDYNIKARFWINSGKKSFIGEGKIKLLLEIKEQGSLRKAAADMKMSYSKAWQTIDKMNKIAEKPLVILKRGGKDGGTAEITEFGEKIIIYFQNFQKELDKFIEDHTQNIDFN